MTKDPFRKAYTQHKSNAKTRKIPFLISFEEWKKVWIESGFWDQRGRGAEKYCMCRIADKGCYELGNVFIAMNKTNISEGNLGKLDSEETRYKKSVAAIGKQKPWACGENNVMHRPDVKAKVSAAIGGANHYAVKGVTTPQGYFVTTKAAAASLNMSKSTVEWRAQRNKFGFSYGKNAAIA